MFAAAAAAGAGSGCVIPPDLQPAQADAGPSAPPVVVSAQPAEFALPGPVVFTRPDTRVLGLDVEDQDQNDSTFVRLYVDYNRAPLFTPLPPLADCQTASPGTVERTVSCAVNTLCNTIEPTDTTNHVLEAVVADRPFISTSDPEADGQPLYQAVSDPSRASKTFAYWSMTCQPP